MSTRHSHYYKNVAHLSTIDVYRVLQLFGVQNPCVQHAVKKLLCLGSRGIKDYERDLREAGDSINRALQMIAEDCNAGTLEPRPAPPEPVQVELAVKVDPSVALLADAVKILQAVEGSGVTPMSDQTIRIHARALLRKIENAQFTPLVLDRNEAAAAQGVDMVQAYAGPQGAFADIAPTTDELSVARSRMTLLADKHDAVSEREVDSYSHIAAGIKGTANGS